MGRHGEKWVWSVRREVEVRPGRSSRKGTGREDMASGVVRAGRTCHGAGWEVGWGGRGVHLGSHGESAGMGRPG
jgi:hypothetical protein